jgi:D-threo-aldose 1-dehydrogenase
MSDERDLTNPQALVRRQLGSTRVEVTRMVFGGAPIGGLFAPVDADTAEGALSAAWDVGIRSFDTAPLYGAGLSEERTGSFLSGKSRSEFTISTKVGRLLGPTEDGVEGLDGFFGSPYRPHVRDYTRDGVRRSLEESCQRLGLERVDVALIHDPDDYWQVAIDEAYPALDELRSEGTIGAIGVGMNQTEMLEKFVENCDLDCVLSAGRYSLLDGSAARTLFPACQAAGVSVLAAGVYKSGILAESPLGPTLDYQPASDEVIARVREISRVCAEYGVSLQAAAIQYVLSHPAVSAVVVGARTSEEVRQNASHLEVEVPTELFDDLAARSLIDEPAD